MSDIVEKHGVTNDPAEIQVATSSVEVPSYRPKQTIGQLLRNDLGFLPILLTLILVLVFFEFVTGGLFLSPQNVSNLIQQVASLGIFSVGIVLVLLLGEIDLSAAAVGMLSSVVMAVLAERHGMPALPAILLSLLAGLICGLVNGFFVSILNIPSFIVTLATFIIASGASLFFLGTQTTQLITNPTILSISGTAVSYFTNVLGVGLPLIAVLLYVFSTFYTYQRRRKAGLSTMPPARLIIQSVVAIVVVMGVIALLQNYDGVPYSTGILFGVILLVWLMLTRTSYGRHIYAVGGNLEAARRAGINITAIRLSVFALCSLIAALAQIVETSRENAISSNLPSMLQLDIIAAAVIGGVSLFGGKGSVWAVVLGMLIVEALDNGLSLLGQTSDVKQMVEGAVLILAVTADALIRRSQARSKSGR
ncbi:xylose ABC transporter permease [Ktedonobacteria bacterium brp13]|nr:xylose ABC transporter permease [Ktedonobacteria bacterium brp13]